jgi:hypothetical protein
VNYDDETLMAYADGELDAEQRAKIDAAIARDPGLARRVDGHRALRAQVAGAFSKVIDSTIPDRLLHAARRAATPASEPRSGKVLRFPEPARRAPATPWRAREWTAMAASLVLGVLLSWRLLAPGDSPVIVAGDDALLARGELATALDNQLASEQRGDEPVLIGLTFKAHDGSYCRSFTLRSAKTAGLACRVGADWQIPATDSAAIPQGDLQQAASVLAPAILKAIEARRVGEPLDAQGEQSAQLSGWNAQRQ